MPTYVYETIEEVEVQRFEIRQSIHDSPLSFHPVSGTPVRRVITGGMGYLKVRSGSNSPRQTDSRSNCCPGCHD